MKNLVTAILMTVVTTVLLGLIYPLAAADFQVPRVARERAISEDKTRQVVAAHTEGRQFGLLGEAVVNVLELNLDLDRTVSMRK
jgi:K+-transporting ATPase ATPase C chain